MSDATELEAQQETKDSAIGKTIAEVQWEDGGESGDLVTLIFTDGSRLLIEGRGVPDWEGEAYARIAFRAGDDMK